jgi:hypothetical protein
VRRTLVLLNIIRHIFITHKVLSMKKSALLILLIGIAGSVNCFAQPALNGQKTIGGADEDELNAIALTNDGGVLASGYSVSGISGDKTQNTHGGYDYWIVKLNNQGQIQWNKSIGGNLDDFLVSMTQTSDGGYILGGYSISSASGDKTENNRGSYDYWIVKISSSGDIQWNKTIGGGSIDYLQSIRQTIDGGYILGGYSNSNISAEKTQNTRGSFDYWIVKLNSSGSIEWDKTIGGSSVEELHSISQTSDGGYILGGSSFSNISGEKTENSKGESDYWIIKLNTFGRIVWDKTIGGSNEEYFGVVQQTADGNYIVGGYSNSNRSGDKSEDNRGTEGTFDFWVVKLSAAGKVKWNKTIGGSGSDNLTSILQTKDGGILMAGASDSNISFEKTENSRGNSDFWIVKLNRFGIIEWDKTVGGNQQDFTRDIKEQSAGNYIIGGNSYSGISGEKRENSRGDLDFWIVRLTDKTTTTSSISKDDISLRQVNQKVIGYPNPAKDLLHMQNAGKATYELINQSGKIVLTKVINDNEEINISHFPAGLYYLRNNSTGEMQKIIITK